jgi:carboxylesterase
MMRSHRVTHVRPLDDILDRQETDFAFNKGSNVLVYLIHGVTGTPVEMSYLARKLSRKNGWDVYAATLPGHCTRLRDLVRTTEQDWRAHVQKQLSFVRDRYEFVFVAGLSAGALLALDASTVVRVDGVGVLSPTFVYDGWNTPWSHAVLPCAMKMVPLSLQRFVFHIDGPPFGIKDELLQASVRQSYRPMAIVREWITEWWVRRKTTSGTAVRAFAAASKGYPIFPLRTLTEIDRLIDRVRARLHEVTTPTVILQAREDDMTSPRNSDIVYSEISSDEKQLVLLDDCYHVITVDKQREAVAENLTSFFRLQTVGKRIHQPLQIGS